MLILIGAAVVLLSTIGGFMIAGGNPLVLLHVSEFVIILGIALGLLIIASPLHLMRDVLVKTRRAVMGKSMHREEYNDLLKLLYELFLAGRRNGLIALEEHVADPATSSIFARYPSFLRSERNVEFLVNALRPVIDGRIKPEQLESLMTEELEAKENEMEHTVHILQMVGDSLPGIGIVAAVLGIINTMAAISAGPEAVGKSVAAALTGTFLGIFLAYGFVNPLAVRIKFNNGNEMQYLRCISISVNGFAKGLAPITAVEVARRSLDHAVQPGGDDLEAELKALPAPGKGN